MSFILTPHTPTSGLISRLVFKHGKVSYIAAGLNIHVPTLSPITTIRATKGKKLFLTKTYEPATTVSSFCFYLYIINKHIYMILYLSLLVICIIIVNCKSVNSVDIHIFTLEKSREKEISSAK